LTERFFAKLAIGSPEELVPAIYQRNWSRAELAGLAPIVLSLADEGDSVACECATEGVRQLAHLAATVVAKLNLNGSSVPLALTGGTLLHSAGYQERLLSALASHHIRFEPVGLAGEPAEGALQLAYQMVAVT
jgi:N-acetylglucosamine kinase